MFDRLRRVTDLFVEGTELDLGDDENGPIVLWINKLNPFQAAESQKDAIARRYVAIANLKKSGEYEGLQAEVSMIDDNALARDYVELFSNEIFMDAMNDVDLDEGLRKEREALERLPELIDDAGTEDSPASEALEEIQLNWFGQFTIAQQAKREQRIQEALELGRAELEERFLEKWREMRTHAEFERELRTTQIFYAIRNCSGKRGAEGVWDHSACDHSKKFLESRALVHDLPQGLLDRVQEKLDEISVPVRAAGNSDAPASSSESSELSSAPEEASNPSSPAETPSAAPSI